MGLKEGEVIQHSMISKSIERAQKKVEENQFGVRKRLLEYDDVMNKQREAVYAKRRHALYGERLSVDINNALYDWCDEAVAVYQDSQDYEGFKLECLRVLANEPSVSEEAFISGKSDIVQEVFDGMLNHYQKKNTYIKEQALPVLTGIKNNKGDTVKNVYVPFTDGTKGLRVIVDLDKTIASTGDHLIDSFERMTVLSSIDEHWKEHLRELDDLKQAANNASLEQKDPLLIYKLESFNLFKQMVSTLNSEMLSLLFRGFIENQDPGQVNEAQRQRRPADDGLQTSRPQEVGPTASAPQQVTKENTQPVRVEKKVGRNEPCPCGSGKKYKKCHGINA